MTQDTKCKATCKYKYETLGKLNTEYFILYSQATLNPVSRIVSYGTIPLKALSRILGLSVSVEMKC